MQNKATERKSKAIDVGCFIYPFEVVHLIREDLDDDDAWVRLFIKNVHLKLAEILCHSMKGFLPIFGSVTNREK